MPSWLPVAHVAIAIGSLLGTVVAWSPTCTYNWVMRYSERLKVDDVICSPDGLVQLGLHERKLQLSWRDTQTRPHFVVSIWRVAWEDPSVLSSYAEMGSDGNFCVFQNTSVAIWCTNSGNTKAKSVAAHNGKWWGLHVGEALTRLMWRAPALPPSPPPMNEEELTVAWARYVRRLIRHGNGLYSNDTEHATLGLDKRTASQHSGGSFLTYQGDGNIVLYGPGAKVLWTGQCNTKYPHSMTIRADGNLVAQDANATVYWESGTAMGTMFTYAVEIKSSHMRILRSPNGLRPPVVIWQVP